MVFQEPHQVPLVFRIGCQVIAHRVRAVGHEAIVEALVVAVIETLGDQVRLPVPVGLGEEKKVWVEHLHRPDHLPPIGHGTRRAHPVTPGLRNDVVKLQHRHVAAHSITLVGDIRKGFDDRRTQGGLRRIKLDDVGPRGEVRVPSESEPPGRCLEEGRGLDLQVRLGPPHEVLGVRRQPIVVRRYVVGNEVKEKPHPASGQLRPGRGEPLGTTESRVHAVAANAVRRADNVRVFRVRQEVVDFLAKRTIVQGDGPTGGTALPDAHEPDSVDPGKSDAVPLGGGDLVEGDRAAAAGRHFIEPRQGTQLVNDRVGGPRTGHLAQLAGG